MIDLISFIDISTQLNSILPLVSNELESFDTAVTSVNIPNFSCNDNSYTVFDFSRFPLVESIEIGNDCFGSVKTFKIDGLSDKWKSFHILNCESLEFIQIGHHSFSDFAGEFELKNLPQLQSIQIGTISYKSCNFYYSSFVIRGTELILNI